MNLLQLLTIINLTFVVLITFVLLKRKNARENSNTLFELIPNWSIVAVILFTATSSVIAGYFYLSDLSLDRKPRPFFAAEQGTGAPDGINTAKYQTWPFRQDAHSLTQYADQKELKLWENSVCGVCALTGVLNSFGQHLNLHDMVTLGEQNKVLTREDGLKDDGLKKLAALEGFTSSQLIAPTLDELVTFANASYPVITLFPEEKYPGGHYIVITGGDKDNLFVADSSRWNRKIITKKWFLKEWDGHSAWIVRPNAPQQRAPQDKLSSTAVPVAYDLSFTIDSKRNKYKCSEIIEIDEQFPFSKIALDSVGLPIESCYVTAKEKQSTSHLTDDFKLQNGLMSINAKQNFPAGKYFIHIDYSTIFSNTLDGFYVSLVKGPSGKQEKIMAALLEPTSARKMFPCFDDPDLKASYTVKVSLDDDLTTISNASIESEVHIANSHSKVVTFARSPKMSTYLLQLVIGHFEATPPVMAKSVSVRVWTISGASSKGIFARDKAAKILNYLTAYFARPTLWKKLDLIAMPNYEDGGMESPGAITFGHRAILTDPNDNSNSHTKQPSMTQYLAHELSHLWFGDAVTLKSWDDLWLNESFATWMSVKAAAQLHPQWHYENELLKWRSHIMELDALPSAPALRQAILEPSFLSSQYALLVYTKGASIVAMLEKAIGEQNFCLGIRHYVASFEAGNANTADFCRSISTATSFPVTEFVTNWTSTQGFPLIWLTQDNESKIFASQKRFVSIDESASALNGHLNTHYQLPKELDLSSTVNLAKSIREIENACAYARIGFNSQLRQNLFRNMASLNTAEKFALVSDSFALMLAGRIEPTDYFTVLKTVRESASENMPAAFSNDSNALLELECKQFATLSSLIERQSTSDNLSAFVREQLRPSLKRIDILEQNDVAGNDQPPSVRPAIYKTLGVYGNDKEIVLDAQKKLSLITASNDFKMPTGMLEAICTVIGHHGASKDYEELAKLFAKNGKGDGKRQFLKGLTAFPETTVISNLLEESLKGVDKEDAIDILHDELCNSINQKVAFSILKNRWSLAQSNLGDPQTSFLLWEMSKNCRSDLLQDLKIFSKTNSFLSQKLDLTLMNERLDAREAFHRNVYPKLETALAAKVY